MGEALSAACPEGIDVYFDNAGGEIRRRAGAQSDLAHGSSFCGAIFGLQRPGRPTG
ncbi:MAG: hypothetical protein R2702_19550 [Acidimicrobiales bacterium]